LKELSWLERTKLRVAQPEASKGQKNMEMNPQTALVERVQAALAGALQIPTPDVTPDLDFGDLPQWDSMGHMEVMLALEEQFGVEVSADTISALTSIPAICAYIEANGHARS
jgi:acyl carrier protein